MDLTTSKEHLRKAKLRSWQAADHLLASDERDNYETVKHTRMISINHCYLPIYVMVQRKHGNCTEYE
jgi:hypothetical protein